MIENIAGRSLFNNRTGIEHDDPVADELDGRKIMRNEDHGHAGFFVLQLLQQIENARPHRQVKRTGRLIQDKQLGIGRKRPCDADALQLPAGQLPGIVVE